MSTHVLALKYRPQQFSEVVGQEHVVKALRHGIINNRLHHAYLLTGTRGVGKTTIARILAKAANCETIHANTPPTDAEPCGKCENCLAIEKGAFPDLMEIDAASNTGVDAMRDLMDTMVYQPYRGRKKIYVIDEVHMLSKSAFNAMLKTLEEPPDNLIFVLATTDPQKVPITILSRCLQFNLKPMPESLLIEHFGKILLKEGVTYDEAALPLIARSADGSVRDGLSLIDQLLAQGNGVLNADMTQNILGLVSRTWTIELLEKILARQTQDLVTMADSLAALSMGFDDVLAELLRTVLALQIVQLGGNAPEGIEGEKLIVLAPTTTPEALQLMYQIIIQGRRDLYFAPDEHSGFVMTLLRMMAFMPAATVSEPPEGFAAIKGQPPSLTSTSHNATSNSSAQKTPTNPTSAKLAAVNQEKPAEKTTLIAKPNNSPSTPFLTENLGFLAKVNWAELIQALLLPPPLKRIANYSAPISCESSKTNNGEEHIITLALTLSEKHLLTSSLAGDFIQALQKHFGNSANNRITVHFRTTEMPSTCVAFIQKSQNQRLKKHIAEALAKNPIWQILQNEFSATLLPENITYSETQ